ncbi:MAG TPA: PadR family transcriptional regulator [Cyclobacteriaceae bacterium]
MKGTHLGEFEELILLSVASLRDDAYAVSVKSEIEVITNRKVNISAIHSSLYRLEDKGFLSSTFGGATQKRGGKKKRYFQVTNTGFAVLQEAKNLKEQFWRNIPQLTFSKTILSFEYR